VAQNETLPLAQNEPKWAGAYNIVAQIEP